MRVFKKLRRVKFGKDISYDSEKTSNCVTIPQQKNPKIYLTSSVAEENLNVYISAKEPLGSNEALSKINFYQYLSMHKLPSVACRKCHLSLDFL